MRIKADKSPMVINDDGMPISVPYHGSAVVSDTIGSDMINAGLAVEYTETSPTGTIEINDNGVYDVFEYAWASVNVPKESGGGSLETFHVTVVDELGGHHMEIPNVQSENGMTALLPFYELVKETSEIDAVAYEGTCLAVLEETGIEVTGDIEADEQGDTTFFVITGDGTITMSSK